MPHLHRFHQPDPPAGPLVNLSPDEAHHALRVLRVRPGDGVELFDGRGNAWSATVAQTTRTDVTVEITGGNFTPRPAPELVLAQAWLHRESVMDDLIREVTVLGVAGICFFRAAHSEKVPKSSSKWNRLMVEACKQCGRRWLPEITIQPSLAAARATFPAARWVVAAMEGPHVPLSAVEGGETVVYAVGPEGDFSPAELSALREGGALCVSLGDYTLRSEAAAMAGVTLIQHHLGHIGGR